MLSSRAVVLGRVLSTSLKTGLSAGHSRQIVRNSGHSAWYYRTAPGHETHSKGVLFRSQLITGIMWWWVLWHLWHEHEHITGEFEYPDVTKWSNAELGIPPDDYEE